MKPSSDPEKNPLRIFLKASRRHIHGVAFETNAMIGGAQLAGIDIIKAQMAMSTCEQTSLVW